MFYRPEGSLIDSPQNQRLTATVEGLTEAMQKGIILEAKAAVCTSSHDLIIELPCADGIIPREEGALGIREGITRDIALISKVRKTVCFKVTELSLGVDGNVVAMLSRREAQEECMRDYISKLSAGDVIDCRVTHLEQFGCFVDIGCGIPSLIPIDAISVSRISHPSDRFVNGQFIKAVVTSNNGERVCLSHKELLGSWSENVSRFSSGETVGGIVRSVEPYGIFVELAPNLAGLAEPKENICAGQCVSVYIKSIVPDRMKVKLVIVDVCEGQSVPPEPDYFISEGHISEWNYSPAESGRKIGSVFG